MGEAEKQAEAEKVTLGEVDAVNDTEDVNEVEVQAEAVKLELGDVELEKEPLLDSRAVLVIVAGAVMEGVGLPDAVNDTVAHEEGVGVWQPDTEAEKDDDLVGAEDADTEAEKDEDPEGAEDADPL